MPFQDTDNKQLIRREWNRKQIETMLRILGKKLTYFGLCGQEAKDLSDWKDLLDQHKTAIERLRKTNWDEDQDLGTRMLRRVSRLGLDEGFELLRGDIEDILIDGRDVYGNQPQLQHYELVNLDYNSGIGFKDEEHYKAKRVKAYHKLFEKQAGQDFLLFVTLTARSKMYGELEYYLQDNVLKQVHTNKLREIVKWYSQRGRGQELYKVKAVLGNLIPYIAGHYHYKIVSFPPIHYEGHEKTQLIHFSFICRYVPRLDLPVGYYQTTEDIIQLPLLEVANGQIIVAENQHPFCIAIPKDDGMQYLKAGIDSVDRLFSIPSPKIEARKSKRVGKK